MEQEKEQHRHVEVVGGFKTSQDKETLIMQDSKTGEVQIGQLDLSKEKK
jgi:hypothetical protein